MKVYAPALVLISVLNSTGWDTDLVVPAARTITVDHVNETTAGHGVYVGQAAGASTAWSVIGGVSDG